MDASGIAGLESELVNLLREFADCLARGEERE